MGRYNLSYSLAETPITSVAEHIGEVLMPSFSRMPEKERQSAVVQSAALMTLVVAPLGVGLGAIAPTLVSSLFDPRWTGMAPMLMILSVMTVFRPIAWPAVAYLQAVGRTRALMTLSIIRACVILGLVAGFGVVGGPLWSCVGACVGYALHSILVVATAGFGTDLSTRTYLLGVLRPLLACVPLFAATVAVGAKLESLGIAGFASLGIQISLGACVYAVSAYLVAGPTMRALIRLAGNALERRPTAPGVP
jgi:PST family polysaccharide transporter